MSQEQVGCSRIVAFCVCELIASVVVQGVRHSPHHPPHFGPEWWREDVAGLRLDGGIPDPYPEQLMRRAFNSSDNKRLAFLGDAICEFLVRRQRNLLEDADHPEDDSDDDMEDHPYRTVCTQCATEGPWKWLNGLPATTADRHLCLYCKKKDFTTNDSQAELARRWGLAASIGRSSKGQWICDCARQTDHKIGTAVEALLAVLACETNLATAGRVYLERALDGFTVGPPDGTCSEWTDLRRLLEKYFKSPAAMLTSSSAEEEEEEPHGEEETDEEQEEDDDFGSVEWRQFAFIGEAITKLCVVQHHYLQRPEACEGVLHELTNTKETKSVKRTWLRQCAEKAGLSSWMKEMFEIVDRHRCDDMDAVGTDCWNAAIGTLFYEQQHLDGEGQVGGSHVVPGGQLGFWDVGGQVQKYVLSAPELEPEPEPEPELEPELEMEAEAGGGGGGGAGPVMATEPQHGELPPVGLAALAAIRCMCVGCSAVICATDKLLLRNGGWPPRLRMDAITTLTWAPHTVSSQRHSNSLLVLWAVACIWAE